MSRHWSERQWRMFEKESGGLGHEREELLATARLCAGRDRSAGLSAQFEASGGHRAAGQDEGTGVRTAAVWLSAAAHPAEARGLGGELQFEGIVAPVGPRKPR